LNQTYLVLGVGLILLGVIAASLGRRGSPTESLPEGKKATTSPIGTVGMFFLGLGIVLVVIGL
jgi:hypothetical protein